MKLSYTPYSLEFRHPFGLAHSSRTTTDVVYVKIEHGDIAGYGEAALPPYLSENQNSVIDLIKKAAPVLKKDLTFIEILNTIDQLAPGNTAAKAAIDIALHDLFGKTRNKPAYKLLGLQKPQPKETSVTIGIGDLDLIPQKLQEYTDFKILKVKLGNKDDKKIIEAIREHTNKAIVVDVNQGWPDKYFALEMIQWLSNKNVLYVEQPLAKENYADMSWLTERSPLPILADESMQRLSDMHKIVSCFSGINLKLMKCTGLHEAVKIIQFAKEKGLKINLGCMSESSCGIAAAAQLMSEVDWIDLDGPMLIKNDPFTGISFSDGKLEIKESAGTGAEPLNKDLNFIQA